MKNRQAHRYIQSKKVIKYRVPSNMKSIMKMES